jgi:hypothetical protein
MGEYWSPIRLWQIDSDYNDWFGPFEFDACIADGQGGSYQIQGPLADWREESGRDQHSISLDPLFADAQGGDFHLRSAGGRWSDDVGGWVYDNVTSRCIDAGDPATAVGDEPSPNGGRVNLGAFGGTRYASKTGMPPSPPGPFSLLTPAGGSTWLSRRSSRGRRRTARTGTWSS